MATAKQLLLKADKIRNQAAKKLEFLKDNLQFEIDEIDKQLAEIYGTGGEAKKVISKSKKKSGKGTRTDDKTKQKWVNTGFSFVKSAADKGRAVGEIKTHLLKKFPQMPESSARAVVVAALLKRGLIKMGGGASKKSKRYFYVKQS